MSILIEAPAGAAAGGATAVVLLVAYLWRLSVEFDRGWRRAEAADPWDMESWHPASNSEDACPSIAVHAASETTPSGPQERELTLV